MLSSKVFHLHLIPLTLLHSERPKLCAILAFLSAIGLKGIKLSEDEALHFVYFYKYLLWLLIGTTFIRGKELGE